MSKNIKKIVVAAFGIVLMVAIIGFNGFAKSNNDIERQDPTIYVFTGSNLSQATNPASWEESEDIPENCGTAETLPCYVSTTSSISSWLSGKTPDQVRTQANARRN